MAAAVDALTMLRAADTTLFAALDELGRLLRPCVMRHAPLGQSVVSRRKCQERGQHGCGANKRPAAWNPIALPVTVPVIVL